MCGIVGYIGNKNCKQLLLDGLRVLEYRGYDSSGIAMITNNSLLIKKYKGKLNVLVENTYSDTIEGQIGIGHTRWATHGEPSDINAHPHYNKDKTIAVVHNGIIENYFQLKVDLEKKGYNFISNTDSELIPHLIDCYLKENNNDLLKTVQFILPMLHGSYALAIISSQHDYLITTRKDSPLVVGILDEGFMIASDVLAMIQYTRKFIKLDNYDLVCLKKDIYQFYNQDGIIIKKRPFTALNEITKVSKEGFDTFMLKEIYEQADRIKDALSLSIIDNNILPDITFNNVKRVHVVSCGTSYYAGLIGTDIIGKFANLQFSNHLSSELQYRYNHFNENDLVIFISQSGETADTIMAIKYIKEHFNCQTLAIVNVLGSSMTTLVDHVIYTRALAEISVASTKAYTNQLVILVLLAIKLSSNEDIKNTLLDYLNSLPNILDSFLQSFNKQENMLTNIVQYVSNHNTILFIGRTIDYYTTLEGALKLKELSYLHTESFAAGELKHGSIALINKGTPVISVITQPEIVLKTISNVQEVKSRGAYTIVLTTDEIANKNNLYDLCDKVIIVPTSHWAIQPIINVIPLQLLAYYTATILERDVDKPRNLAKSVTVE